MRVVLPYTRVEDGVLEALDATGYPVELRDVSGSDTDYWRLLSELWTAGQTFAIVEQDILVKPATLARLDECPQAWCAATYDYFQRPGYAGLGCVRFRAELLSEHPDLMDAVAEHEYDGHCSRHWCVNDAAMQRELWKRGRRVCLHAPVKHLHDRPTHGCCG